MPHGERRFDLHDTVEIVVTARVDRGSAIQARLGEHGDGVLLCQAHHRVFQGLARVPEIRAEAEIGNRHGITSCNYRSTATANAVSVFVRAVMARVVGCAFGLRAALHSVARFAAPRATAAPPSFSGASVLPALREQSLPRSDVSFDELRPPRSDRLFEFARFAAQQEEIIPRSKSLVFQQL